MQNKDFTPTSQLPTSLQQNTDLNTVRVLCDISKRERKKAIPKHIEIDWIITENTEKVRKTVKIYRVQYGDNCG